MTPRQGGGDDNDDLNQDLSSEEPKLYTKSDLLKIIEQSKGGNLPVARRTWTEDEVRGEIVRASTRAAQLAISHVEDARAKINVEQDGDLILSREEVLRIVDDRLRSGAARMMGDFGLPIRTEEERRQTILTINRMLNLEKNSRKFMWTMLTSIMSVIIGAAGLIIAYIFTHGKAG